MDTRTEILTDLAALRWQMAMGADEALSELPVALQAIPSSNNRHPRDAKVYPREGGGGDLSASTPSLAKDSGQSLPKTALARGNDGTKKLHVPPPRPDLSTLKTLPELRAALEGISTLGIKETAMSFVFGEGLATNPVVMLVGEAPGEEEDRTGRALAGQTGELLEKMLAAIGLTPAQVYLTNMLPWRPPGNRTPKPEEVATCLPYLMRHIELVQPKLLLMLGGPAAKALLSKEESITRLRGTWWDYHSAGLASTLPTLVTYHPGYLLNSPAQKRESWRDLRLLKHKIDSL